jgi:hypothetical protein
MPTQDSTPTPEQRANSIVTDPLKGSGITVVTIPVLLLDEQWQQLRDEAAHYGVCLDTMVHSHISAHLMRTALDAEQQRLGTS